MSVSGVISSLIGSTLPYSRTEPDELEDAMEFVSRMYEDVHNRSLTDEEKIILEQYYNGNMVGTVRRVGITSSEERQSVRI